MDDSAVKTKRILVVGYTENPGGVESLMLSVLDSLSGSCIALDFLANTDRIVHEDTLRAYGSKIYSITPRRKNRMKFYADLRDFFRKHAYEYAAVWENVNSLANIDYLLYAKRFGIQRRVIHCHNSKNSEGFIRGVLHGLNRRRIRSIATDFWSVSDEASAWFYGSDFRTLPNYQVVTNSINASRFSFSQRNRDEARAELGVPEDAVLIGNVGRLHEQKNQGFMLRIIERLVIEGMNCWGLIVGSGELEQDLKSLVVRLGIQNRVIFTGALDSVAPLYSAMDLFLFPSLNEGLGIAFLEAQANGLPCLVSEAIPNKAIVSPLVLEQRLANTVDEWVHEARELLACGRTEGNCLIGTPFDQGNYLPLLDGIV